MPERLPPADDPFPPGWTRSSAPSRDLTFAEVRKGLQALSSLYVGRRQKIAGGAALEGNGKRAAFALYYGPAHFLLVRAIVRALDATSRPLHTVVDLGCGTGAAGAAWAVETGAAVDGIDRSGWAVAEARWTLARLRLRGTAKKGDVSAAAAPVPPGAIVSAFTVNELEEAARTRLLATSATRRRAGAASSSWSRSPGVPCLVGRVGRRLRRRRGPAGRVAVRGGAARERGRARARGGARPADPRRPVALRAGLGRALGSGRARRRHQRGGDCLPDPAPPRAERASSSSRMRAKLSYGCAPTTRRPLMKNAGVEDTP